MQYCTRQSIPKVVRFLILGQHNYGTNGTNSNNNATTQKQPDHALICTEWEETIIREHRTADVSFESMQKDTIDQIHSNYCNQKNHNKDQSNEIGMMKFFD